MGEQVEPAGEDTSPAEADKLAAAARTLTVEAYQALRNLSEARPSEMTEKDEAAARELLRAEYALRLDLYKHYMTVAVSFALLYYGVTGAVVTYVLNGGIWLAWALLLPFVMSIFFALVYRRAWDLFRVVDGDIQNLAAVFGFRCGEVSVLTRILEYSYYMYLCNSVGLLALFALKLCGMPDFVAK